MMRRTQVGSMPPSPVSTPFPTSASTSVDSTPFPTGSETPFPTEGGSAETPRPTPSNLTQPPAPTPLISSIVPTFIETLPPPDELPTYEPTPFDFVAGETPTYAPTADSGEGTGGTGFNCPSVELVDCTAVDP